MGLRHPVLLLYPLTLMLYSHSDTGLHQKCTTRHAFAYLLYVCLLKYRKQEIQRVREMVD